MAEAARVFRARATTGGKRLGGETVDFRKWSTGYKWRVYSKRFRTEHPLCLHCDRRGIATPSAVVDHIVPHRGDVRLFWQASNHQALCKSCHDVKTATEDGGFVGIKG